jgi:hypothetical protein
MANLDFDREEQIASALANAVKANAPPAGLQEAIRERLFGRPQDLASPMGSGSTGPRSAERPDADAADRRAMRLGRRVARYAAGMAMIASLLLMLAIWRGREDIGAIAAFADVQEAIRHIESAIEIVDCPRTPWMNHRVLYRRDCEVVRIEWPNGIVCLRDAKRGGQLVLNPKNKTARTEDALRGVESMHIPGQLATPREFLDRLAAVEGIAVERLGEREFDGRKLAGFVLPRDRFSKDTRMLCHLWVDLKTRLPSRYEFLPEHPGDLAANFLQYTLTFTFNPPLNASLFRLLPPEGHTVLHGGLEVPYLDQLPLPPNEVALASPVILPGLGIGPARFGMSLEQVIAALGQPDNASDHRELTPEEERQQDEAYEEASKKADKKELKGMEKGRFVSEAIGKRSADQRSPNGMCLEYISRGFVLYVLKDKGLVRIFCYGDNSGMRPFAGKTSKGIGMGATVQEIEIAYGPPSDRSEQPVDGLPDTLLLYKSLKTIFQVRDGRLWHVSLDKP